MAQYEDTLLQRQAIQADNDRTKMRVIGWTVTIAMLVAGGLLSYGCTMSHEYDIKEQAKNTAENQACIKAGSNVMPVQTITKGSDGVKVNALVSCVIPADFPAVNAANANIVQAFAGS